VPRLVYNVENLRAWMSTNAPADFYDRGRRFSATPLGIE